MKTVEERADEIAGLLGSFTSKRDLAMKHIREAIEEDRKDRLGCYEYSPTCRRCGKMARVHFGGNPELFGKWIIQGPNNTFTVCPVCHPESA